MSALEQLEPKTVFHYFEDLCGIPHGSGNTQAISDYCARFANEHDLPCVQDSLGNVIIKKSATRGYEGHPSVMLQGHLDMVCEKNPMLTNLDMTREGLRLGIDGDEIHANGTTLGGDDGIAVAYGLALLAAEDIPHPALEVVLTVDEEIGLLGAAGLDMSRLQSHVMLNLDSEEEGVFLTSCAGGVTSICELPLTRQKQEGSVLTFRVEGLLGGHSGTEIDKGRANSNKLMARFLYALNRKAPFALVCIAGGLKDNAIPLMTQAMIVTDAPQAATTLMREFNAVFQNEFKTSDPGVQLVLSDTHMGSENALIPEDTKRMLTFLGVAPNGIQTMSADVKGLVESSLNLGILKVEESRLIAEFSVRSSISTCKHEILSRLEALTEIMGGTMQLQGNYPAWEHKKDSKLRDIMVQTYSDLFGKEPAVTAIHAGLECGLFAGKLEGLDCISLGPTIRDIHTSKERLSISSTARVWELLLATLKQL